MPESIRYGIIGTGMMGCERACSPRTRRTKSRTVLSRWQSVWRQSARSGEDGSQLVELGF